MFVLAEDNPSDVQQFFAAVWDVSSIGDTIDDGKIQKALAHVFATERKGYETQVRGLTSNQIRWLRALARIGGRRRSLRNS
ncbi:MAG: hypothetical protein EHM18_10400 [Acidobacteria bacterium]|nr:MAG: hypothetical protein EHM18_10400 [Acidobacteriota bacterium]